MRTALFVTGCALLSAGVGCKWTDFDDLEKDTWVSATDKPNGDSTDYGVAIQRGQRGSNGGKLVVIGAGQAQYTELVYSANGDVDLAPTAQKLNSQFGIGNLDQQPILIPDPTSTSDEVSLVVNAGGQTIAVLTGTGGLIAHQTFGAEQPDAATYMVPPPRVDLPANPTPAQVLIGSTDTLIGAFVMNYPAANPVKCQVVDEAASVVTIRGLGATRLTSTTFDDVVLWGTVGGNAGKLLLYPGSVFNGNPPVGTCVGSMQQPLAGSTSATTPFVPAKGSQIVMVDATHFLAIGHKDLGNADSFLGFYTIDPGTKTITATGVPVLIPDLRTAAVLTVGAKKYVIAGYPTAIIENVKAGRVLIFPLDMTAGIDATPAAQLYDSQPEDNQQFGRAVAAMPFNGAEIVAVAADNEIFAYFELGPSTSNPPMGSIYGDKRAR